MIIRTVFEVNGCNECWFFEADDYDYRCRLIGDYFCDLNDGYHDDFDVNEEISKDCPFRNGLYDEDTDTLDLDALLQKGE